MTFGMNIMIELRTELGDIWCHHKHSLLPVLIYKIYGFMENAQAWSQCGNMGILCNFSYKFSLIICNVDFTQGMLHL